LLGVLERRSFRRLGSSKTISVDVRVVCATNRDLRSEVNAGRFRQDLYFRIAVFLVRVPPLREHPSDIPMLAEHFLREAGLSGEVEEVISAETMEQLKAHSWPGNVRELRNVVEMALAAGETRLEVGEGAPSSSSENAPWPDLAEIYARPYKTARSIIVERFEGSYLKQLIERTGGNVSRAAREAKIHRSYLIEMLKRHPIKKD
jgi:DNA-binding NtrC family response regulator